MFFFLKTQHPRLKLVKFRFSEKATKIQRNLPLVSNVESNLRWKLRQICVAFSRYMTFGKLVNPISARGTDYAHLITTGTPEFLDLSTAL